MLVREADKGGCSSIGKSTTLSRWKLRVRTPSAPRNVFIDLFNYLQDRKLHLRFHWFFIFIIIVKLDPFAEGTVRFADKRPYNLKFALKLFVVRLFAPRTRQNKLILLEADNIVLIGLNNI